jgi:undecaprenyl-diphosphatase
MKKKIKILNILLIAFFMIVFITLSVLQISNAMDKINLEVGNFFQRGVNKTLTNIVIVITNFGEWFFYVPCIIILLIIPKTRWKIGLIEAIMMSLSTLINVVLKEIYAVERPNVLRLISINGYSFPSGHAMHSAVFVGVLLVLLFEYNGRNKILYISLGVFFVLLIGWTRLYLGVHTITDIIAGYSVGLLIVITGNFTWKLLKQKQKNKNSGSVNDNQTLEELPDNQ